MAKYELMKRQSMRRLAQTESYLADLRIQQKKLTKAVQHLKASVRLYDDLGMKESSQIERLRLLKIDPIDKVIPTQGPQQ